MLISVMTKSGFEVEGLPKKNGALEIIEKTNERQDGHVMWLVRCECGRYIKVRATRLKNEIKRSCGKCFYGDGFVQER